ncbi:MAG: hypothetical protein GXY41_11490 [Phycisphaerae bacterium]|nr:hypothetical protein [Phycisphaerae bacterium]
MSKNGLSTKSSRPRRFAKASKGYQQRKQATIHCGKHINTPSHKRFKTKNIFNLAKHRFDRLGLGRYFAFYDERRCHRSLECKTPATIYGHAKGSDVDTLKKARTTP